MGSMVARGFVGRARMVQEILADIRSGLTNGAVIIGDRGVGKTAVMHAVVRELDESVPVFRIHASKTFSGVPYGSLAPLLSGLSADEMLSSAAVLRELTVRLSEGSNSVPRSVAPVEVRPVLVVDPGDQLDASSVAVIEQLAATKKVFVLTAVQDGAVSVGFGAVEGLLTRHYLYPLDLVEVHEVCEQTLDGTVAGCASAALAEISGGNPRFLLAVLSQARRNGQLAPSNGVWLLSGESVPFDRDVTDLIQSQLTELPEDAREVLELVGLAEPLPLSVVFSLGGYDAVDVLSEAKFITITGAPDPVVRSRDPLHGEVIRQLIPTGRTRRLREHLAEYLPVGTDSTDARLRDVQWSLEWGFDVSEADVVDAARTAIDSFDPDFAVSAASAVKKSEHIAAARVECAWACYLRGDAIRAFELLEGIPKIVRDHVSLKRAVLLSIRLRFHLGNPGHDLQDEAGAWSAALERISKDVSQGTTGTASVFTGRIIDLLVQSTRVSQGQYEEATGVLKTVLTAAESAEDDESALLALTMLGECATATGHPETGASLTSRALTILTGDTPRWKIHHEYVLTRHVMALIRSGQWEEIDKAHQQYGSASWRNSVYSGGGIDFTRSLVTLSHARDQTQSRETGEEQQGREQGHGPGRGDVELVELGAAIEGLRSFDLEHLLPLALGTAAYTSAVLGRLELAEEHRANFEQAQPGGSSELRLLSRGFNAAAGLLLTGDSQAMQDLVCLADQAQTAGMRTTELELRLLALREGNLAANARLLALTEQFEGPQAALTHTCLRAITQEDIPNLLEVADQSREAGYGMLAIICLQEAHRLAENAGHQSQLRRIRQRLARTPQGPAGTIPVSVTKLTKRERAVAALTVDGHSNADIADKLFLSVRTVEGHLYRVFEKVGVTRREHLTTEHINQH